MLLAEIKNKHIYFTTDDRAEILELMMFLTKTYGRLEEREQKQTTIYEPREEGHVIR